MVSERNKTGTTKYKLILMLDHTESHTARLSYDSKNKGVFIRQLFTAVCI